MQISHDVYKVFNALGDPNRFAIFKKISNGPISVSDLAADLDISLPAIGQHISILEECRLATSKKVGRVRTCSVNMAGLQKAESWMAKHKKTWEERLDRLENWLDEDSNK